METSYNIGGVYKMNFEAISQVYTIAGDKKWDKIIISLVNGQSKTFIMERICNWWITPDLFHIQYNSLCSGVHDYYFSPDHIVFIEEGSWEDY